MRWTILTDKELQVVREARSARWAENRERRRVWFSAVRADVWARRQHRRSAREQAKRIRTAKKEMRIQARYEADREWHEWFAWYPVFDRINGLSMFGERILRKQMYRPDNFLERFFGWEYRPITILPKDIGLTTDGIQ